MLGYLRHRSGVRAVLAALFVYVLFGHTVLAEVVSARMVLGSADATICYGAGHDENAPAQHSNGSHQACIVCAFVGAVPPVPAVAVLAEVQDAAQKALFAGRPAQAPLVGREHTPRLSQGPPVAA